MPVLNITLSASISMVSGKSGLFTVTSQLGIAGNNRRIFFFITNKDNAGFTRLLIVFFTEAISADIAVKHVNIDVPDSVALSFKAFFTAIEQQRRLQ